MHFIKLIVTLFFVLTLSGCQHGQISQKSATQHSKQVEIAIMLPITGEHGSQGTKFAEFINAGIQESATGNINTTIYDTSNDVELQRAMDEAIKKKTKIILGPLFSNQVISIDRKASEKGVYIITLSNNSALANNDNVFVFGHAPIKQTEQLMEYLLQNNYKDVILLLPNASHTKTLVKIVESIVQDHNGTIRLVQEYNNTPEDIDAALAKVSEVVNSLNESDTNTTKPIVYLADDPKNLGEVFIGLNKYGIDKRAVVCGDNRLDINSNTKVNITFTGSLAHVNSKAVVVAEERFGSPYLSYMDKLAYDLGVLAGFSAGEEFNKDVFLTKMVNNTYRTTSGMLKFFDHIAQRKYDIISRTNGQYRTIFKGTYQKQ